MTLTCLVAGGSRRVYQWLKNGRPVHTSSTNSFSLQNNSLHIAPVTKEDIGNYSCLVKNPVSKMESDIIMPTIFCKFLQCKYIYMPLEKEMATHSSILAWEVLWSEEPGGPRSVVSHKSDMSDRLSFLLGSFLQSCHREPQCRSVLTTVVTQCQLQLYFLGAVLS